MANYSTKPGVNTYIVLSGSITADGDFATQPIAGEIIIYPVNLTVDAQLNISGPSGTHKLWHVQLDGTTIATTKVITPGDVAAGSATYKMPVGYTMATLQTGFDDYVFDGWSPQPVVGERLITETSFGYFDNLGNYYSNIENIHDAWFVNLDGTTTHFTIDNRLTVISTDNIPDQFNFVDKTDQAVSTFVESAPVNILGMSANIDCPVTVTGGQWSKSSDGGQTYSSWSDLPGFVRNGDKVKLRHQTPALGLVQTDTTFNANGVSDVFSTTTIADLTPDNIVFIAQINVELSEVRESNAVLISGLTDGATANVTVSGGSWAKSTDGGNTYSAFGSGSGTVENGDYIKLQVTSSASYTTQAVVTINVGNAQSTWVVSTKAAVTSSVTIYDPDVVLDKFYGDKRRMVVENGSSNWGSFLLYNDGVPVDLSAMTDCQIVLTDVNTPANVYSARITTNPSYFKYTALEGRIDVKVGKIGAPVGFYDLDLVYFDSAHPDGAYMTDDSKISVIVR